MDPRLLKLVDKKIEQLRHYNEITSQIIYEDVDGVGELINRRQEIVTAVDGISMEMRSLINKQSIERKDVINDLLCFKEISGLSGSMLELSEKINELKELTETIKQNDAMAVERLEGMRDELYAELTQSAKGKKVVNYFGATAVDINKGSKFNAAH
ncbi:MAG: hypothetical protein IJ368_04840 [Oscillospiraceae bacterium]|nr:hypothetical protein [Oscillospiraceae bacterium]